MLHAADTLPTDRHNQIMVSHLVEYGLVGDLLV